MQPGGPLRIPGWVCERKCCGQSLDREQREGQMEEPSEGPPRREKTGVVEGAPESSAGTVSSPAPGC